MLSKTLIFTAFQKTCIQKSWGLFTGYNEAKAKVGKTLGFVCFWNSKEERVMEHSFKNNLYFFFFFFSFILCFSFSDSNHFSFQHSVINNYFPFAIFTTLWGKYTPPHFIHALSKKRSNLFHRRGVRQLWNNIYFSRIYIYHSWKQRDLKLYLVPP